MSAIPEGARDTVRVREQLRCCRCGAPAPTGEWHHRRSRRVAGSHQHCACNGVWLCSTCHRWVHAHPLLARHSGFVVSMHENQPFRVPVMTPWGVRLHDCEGEFIWIDDEYEEEG